LTSSHQDWPVLIVSHGYENIYERGFCNGLADYGFESLLVSSDRTDYGGLRPGVKWINLRGSQDESRPKWRKVGNILWYYARLMSFVATRRRYIVHSIGLIDPALLCGVFLGSWFRVFARRYVMTVHDLLPHDRETRWNERLYGIAFRLTDFLVVHTSKMRDELVERYGVRPENVFVMEHGLEPLADKTGRRFAPLALAQEGTRKLRLLFFGKVMRYKGVDILLDALRQVAFPFELTIAGKSTSADLTKELRERIASHPHAASIRWANEYVPENALPGLFTDANALVLPYRKIDQSGVLFQALRFGLPIVATRVGTFCDYVGDSVGELSEPDDPAAFAQALERFHARVQTLDRAQIAAFGATFEWQRTVSALENIYDRTYRERNLLAGTR
jgi:glycosyltransferase involved in cell wall biosynthesis